MIRQRHSRALQSALLLCCFARLSQGYAQSSSGDAVYHLHGAVVDGITGRPIARALVQSNDQRLGVMTDSEGNFAVDLSVPPRATGANTLGRNAFVLTAQKPGYMPSEQPSSLPLDETLSSTDVKLKLMPAAIIAGRVSAIGTDSATNVRVMLLLHQADGEGRRIWNLLSSQITNSRGEFRFSNLRPGEYTIMSAEWRGEGPLPQQRNAITQQYPPVFYGDVESFAASVKLHVHFGDTTQAELHLHLATYYPVTVPLAGLPPNASVNVRLVDADSFGGSALNYNARDGAVEGSLPNGHYTFLLSSSGQQQAFALMPINVDGAPVRAAAIALAPAASITIRVHTQFTRQQTSGGSNSAPTQRLSPQVQLLLRAADGSIGFGVNASQPGPDGDLMLQNAQPGRYFVYAQSFRGYVASITSDGVDLMQQPLVVNAGGTAPPIDVTLRDDSATITGTVTSSSGPLPRQSFILLLPTDATAQFTQSFAGPDGKFTVPNLAPGSYRAFAFRSNRMRQQIPYRDAEAMRQYDGKGVTITVAPDQQVQLDVPLLDEAEVENN